MNQVGLSHPAVASPNLPVLDAYPFLVVRLQPEFYHLSILPADRELRALRDVGRSQAQINDLQVCLALGPDSCFFYQPDGTEDESDYIPRRGIIACGTLKTADVFPMSAEIVERRLRLDAFAKSVNGGGYAFGDLTRGGHEPSKFDAESLTGSQPNDIPFGLTRCSGCGEWSGECIDPDPLIPGLLIRIHCLCENMNLCAHCLHRLCDRKVDASYYSEQDGKIWYVPGFCALRHRCVEVPIWQA
jgi:hypothetical protein